jgi:hypothetical protein
MNKSIRFTVMIFMMCFIFGCSSNKPFERNYTERGGQAEISVEASERSIIKSVSLTLKVESLAESLDALNLKIKNASGYIDAFHSNDDRGYTMSLRIPETNLDSFLDGLDIVGKVVSKSIWSRDVTTELNDTSANLKNLIALRERYRVLLGKADSVHDVLEIEKELANVQTKIDLLDGQMKLLENSVALSSVDLEVNRKRILGPLGYISKGFIWIIGKLFILQ